MFTLRLVHRVHFLGPHKEQAIILSVYWRYDLRTILPLNLTFLVIDREVCLHYGSFQTGYNTSTQQWGSDLKHLFTNVAILRSWSRVVLLLPGNFLCTEAIGKFILEMNVLRSVCQHILFKHWRPWLATSGDSVLIQINCAQLSMYPGSWKSNNILGFPETQHRVLIHWSRRCPLPADELILLYWIRFTISLGALESQWRLLKDYAWVCTLVCISESKQTRMHSSFGQFG